MKEVICILYYATRLSANMAHSPEGYLICRGVPVARTGVQYYLPEELGLEGGPAVPVHRPEEEVFSEACIASFEGKPVTDDHPENQEGVDAGNIGSLQRGHAQNLRRGTGTESSMLLADLVITDPDTIRHILAGKREISCGYTYRLFQEEGRYIQREIRGNHIAIVDRGRAGPTVAIRDAQPEKNQKIRRKEKMKTPNSQTMMKLISAALKSNDLQPEDLPDVLELARRAEELLPEASGGAQTPAVTLPAGKETEDFQEESFTASLLGKLDTLIDLMTRFCAGRDSECGKESQNGADSDENQDENQEGGCKNQDEAAENQEGLTAGEEKDGDEPGLQPEEVLEMMGLQPEAILQAEKEEENQEEDPDLFLVTPEESQRDENQEGSARDRALRAGLKALGPVIARLPANLQRAAADEAYRAMTRTGAPKYSDLLRPGSRKTDGSEVGKRIMKARNCNYRD